MTTYTCDHNHRPSDVDKTREDYVAWKYSKGYDGDRSMCYDCWRKQK